jgi:hypothetical protein
MLCLWMMSRCLRLGKSGINHKELLSRAYKEHVEDILVLIRVSPLKSTKINPLRSGNKRI